MIVSTYILGAHSSIWTRVNGINSAMSNARFLLPNARFTIAAHLLLELLDPTFIQTFVIGIFH